MLLSCLATRRASLDFSVDTKKLNNTTITTKSLLRELKQHAAQREGNENPGGETEAVLHVRAW